MSGLRWLLPALISVACVVATPARAQSEQAVVESLHASLLEVMRNAQALGYSGRSETLQPVIERSFDIAYITRVVLGRNWKTLDESQQAALVERFRALTVANYAAQFDGYGGERMVVLSHEAMPRGRVLVRSQLLSTAREAVSLDYLLHETDAGPRIVNVIADGVSDISLKRAQVAVVMREHGYAELVGRLDQQLRELAAP